jgi:hypothetical protein
MEGRCSVSFKATFAYTKENQENQISLHLQRVDSLHNVTTLSC